MSLKRIFKYTFIYAGFLIAISLFFSINLSSAITNYIQNGLLDPLEVKQDSNYKKEYYYKDTKMDSFNSYSDAYYEGKYSLLLYADNGLIYKRKTPIGTQAYILDYSWLSKNDYDKKEIVSYVTDNQLIMILRTLYLTTSLWYMILVFIVLLVIARYISQPILYIYSNILAYYKYKSLSKEQPEKNRMKYYELFRGLIVTKSLNALDKSKELMLMTGFYAYFIIYFLSIKSSLGLLSEITLPILLFYLGFLSVFLLFIILKVNSDNENKLLIKELSDKLNINQTDLD